MVHDLVRVYLIYKPLTVKLNYYLAGDNAFLIFNVNVQFELYKLNLHWIHFIWGSE